MRSQFTYPILSHQEKLAFANWINNRLGDDKYLNKKIFTKYLPIDPDTDHLFDVLKDGIMFRYIELDLGFCILININFSSLYITRPLQKACVFLLLKLIINKPGFI